MIAAILTTRERGEFVAAVRAKIMRKTKENRERCRFNLIEKRLGRIEYDR
jgi:hypothetical protein